MSGEYKHIGHPAVLVIEECSELIQALTKVQRFGWLSCHPETGEPNIDQVKREINDVSEAINKLEIMMRRLLHDVYNKEPRT